MQVKICLAQLEPVIGSIENNVRKMSKVVESYSADLYVFPEMFLVGYMVKDLVYKIALPLSSKYIDEVKQMAKSKGVGVIVGFPELSPMGYIYNSMLAVDENGKVFVYRKRHLPTFSVFDEHRWFKQFKGKLKPWKFKDILFGLAICYDTFFPEIFKAYALMGAKVQVIISAAPDTSVPLFHRVIMSRAIETTTYIIWVNTVGIMNGLTFGGGSMVVSPLGRAIEKLKDYEEDVKVVEVDMDTVYRCRIARPVIRDSMREDAEELLRAYNEMEQHLNP